MQKALLSALSGLRINQQYLDVIGNNLANTSTPGYKGARVTFSELLGQTLRPASGPTSNSGGRNPSQIGGGAEISSIDRNFAQGSLLNTGRQLDLGIQGEGFFVVSDGNEDYFTRVGTFGMDANEYLIDLRSGYRVKNTLGQGIQIELNTVIPAQESENVDLQGNLPGIVNGPLAEELLTDAGFEDHRAAVLAADGAGPTYSVNPGDVLYIEVDGNAAIPYTFTAADIANPGAATTAELVTAINANITGVTAIDNGGQLELVSNSTGLSSTLYVTMDPANTAGAALFAANQGTTIQGTEAIVTATTNLNDLSGNNTDYVAGDRITITGTLANGVAVSGEFMYGDPAVNPAYHGQDMQSLVARMNQVLQSTDPVNGATATLETDGTVKITANATGDANFSLMLQDATSATGQTNWSSNFFAVNVQGTDPDTANIVSSVYDSQGQPHSLTLDFERQGDGTWTLTPSVEATEGTVLTSPITGITFDSNGMLQVAPLSQIDVQWTSVPGTQSVSLNLGSAGMTDGLTQFGVPESVIALSDGYTAGSLASIAVRGDGMIEGFYTNGQIQELDQVGIALFMNPAGLQAAGGTLFQSSSNSGQAMLFSPQAGSSGTIVAGTLEGSNVDIAEEFVRLIEAQRSFQANARMVTTTDEVLAELVNLV
ncbi:MAG: flagellar hook-basal body complex protein [Planctomycetes bacterium]|nr:flagellar hook-basal body complex protein [Planctomycetota bacterium]